MDPDISYTHSLLGSNIISIFITAVQSYSRSIGFDIYLGNNFVSWLEKRKRKKRKQQILALVHKWNIRLLQLLELSSFD